MILGGVGSREEANGEAHEQHVADPGDVVNVLWTGALHCIFLGSRFCG